MATRRQFLSLAQRPARSRAPRRLRSQAADALEGDVALPLSAVLADRSGARRVLVVDATGRTHARPVQLLSVSSTGARVRGLAAGQRVIAAGGELIKAGERVRPLPFTP